MSAELEKLGFQAGRSAQKEKWARILLVGAGKIGKTTCLINTAPGPVAVINGDGEGATSNPFTNPNAERYSTINVNSVADWRRAQNLVKAAADRELCRTVVVDTVSYIADTIMLEAKEMRQFKENTLAMWGFIADELQVGLLKLMQVPAHLFIVAHLDVVDDSTPGVLPLIKGGTKRWLPGRVQDWLMFECDSEEQDPAKQRRFILGPQRKWQHSGRNIRRSCVVPANVIDLFKEMEIEP